MFDLLTLTRGLKCLIQWRHAPNQVQAVAILAKDSLWWRLDDPRQLDDGRVVERTKHLPTDTVTPIKGNVHWQFGDIPFHSLPSPLSVTWDVFMIDASFIYIFFLCFYLAILLQWCCSFPQPTRFRAWLLQSRGCPAPTAAIWPKTSGETQVRDGDIMGYRDILWLEASL